MKVEVFREVRLWLIQIGLPVAAMTLIIVNSDSFKERVCKIKNKLKRR